MGGLEVGGSTLGNVRSDISQLFDHLIGGGEQRR
jgi:hypothetical protein